MHLRGFPRYFVKGEERRAAYFTVEETELLQQGWVPAESQAAESPDTKPEQRVEVESVKQEVIVEPPRPEEIIAEVVEDEVATIPAEEEEPSLDFEFMTKSELIEYAADRGVELKQALHKSELVEECKRVRARCTKGRYLGDDPSTPEVDEAWVIG